MRGASRGSLLAARERLEPVLAGGEGRSLGEELFAVLVPLDASPALRRALTDPSRDGEAKADLVRRLFGDKVGGTTVDVVSGLVRGRWSAARDLGDAVEQLAALAVVAGAESDGQLDALEDELFRFRRVVEGDPDLARALRDRGAPPSARVDLVERLAGDKVGPATLVLLREAAAHPRGRRVEQVLEDFGQVAAERRERTVAVVSAAVPLTEQQRDRLAAALQRIYGRPVHLNVEVDPDVLGGMRVQVGDEVLDGSVVARLEDARRRLTG
jgi:F-type H+-transporting ATPase subunit delta